MSFNTKLTALLKTDPRFVDDEGETVLAAVQDRAWKLDHDLVKLLLSDKEIKAKFFEEIEGHWIFNLNTFIDYVSQKNFLDNSYTRFRNRIGLTIGGKYLRERGDVALVWPYKDTVLEGGQTQEEEKRKEIFFNEVLAEDEINRLLDPKVLTNFTRYTAKGKQPVKDFRRYENGAIRENLILKGNNLLALHTLKQQFRGQVKLIYIDPPYNSGAEGDTFAYNNYFKHSTWLTFMLNRLEIAKDFLHPEGFIAIAIDHSELFYLGALADEVFGRENRVGLVTVLNNPKGRNLSKFFSSNSEFMLVFAKDIEMAEFNQVAISEEVKDLFTYQDKDGKYRYEPFMRARTVWLREYRPKNWYPIYVSKDFKHITSENIDGYHEVFPITNNGREMAWKNIKKSFDNLNKDDYFMAKMEDGKVRIYHKYREQQVYKNVWTDKKYQSEFHGTNLLKKMFGENVFSYPKSIYLVMDVLKIMTEDDDIILDFFGGSGTTAHAVLDLNKEDGGKRQFILCEQMDYAESITVERVKKVIEGNKSGDFIYYELMKYNEASMECIQAARSSKELLTIWQEIAECSFLNWYVNPEMPEEAIKDFKELGKGENGLEKQKHLLAELLDKNQLYVNLSEIDDAQFKVSKEDKALNKAFYGEAYNA